MKKIKTSIAVLLFMSVVCLAQTRWGRPNNVDISAYAVNDYPFAENLNYSIAHKNKFIEQIQGKLRSKYPNIYSIVIYNRENSYVTKNIFLSDITDYSEFVFFAGHGLPDTLFFYNSIAGISNIGKKFGGYTRWVIFDACLTLNAPIIKMVNWFNGAHAILGNKSKGLQFIYSKEQHSKFAARFITNEETIWSAHLLAVFEAIHSIGFGIEPAIVYLTGNADNGQYVDFSEERLRNTYNGPFWLNNGALGSVNVMRKSLAFGDPEY